MSVTGGSGAEVGVGAGSPAGDVGEVALPRPRRRPSALRGRLLDAAVAMTTEVGWTHVTMARLAAEVGVSRQTVYNEIGAKPQLAEAMILRELHQFLDAIACGFTEHPDDLVAGVRAACTGVLELAHGNELLRAVASATHGADTELLPYLSSHSESLLEGVSATVREHLTTYDHPLGDREVAIAVDLVVRSMFSHVMYPAGTPRDVADGMAWAVAQVLAGAAAEK